jgi:hypothetical protein
MKEKILRSDFAIITGLIIVAAISRLLARELHLWNFTPIAGMALFAGAKFQDKKFAFIIPIVVMLLTDSIIGFYSGVWAIYLCFVVITCLGFTLRNNFSARRLFFTSLLSSVLFYLLSNTSQWIFVEPQLYAHTIAGYVTCLTAGLPFIQNNQYEPFFVNQVLGDLFYSFVLFYSFAFIMDKRMQPISDKND